MCQCGYNSSHAKQVLEHSWDKASSTGQEQVFQPYGGCPNPFTNPDDNTYARVRANNTGKGTTVGGGVGTGVFNHFPLGTHFYTNDNQLQNAPGPTAGSESKGLGDNNSNGPGGFGPDLYYDDDYGWS